jgi:hypothetical protein
MEKNLALVAAITCCFGAASAARAQATYQFTTFDVPGAGSTHIYGISGSTIVGSFDDGQGEHGFVYNGSSFTTLNVPSAIQTEALAVSGSLVVGDYTDSQGNFHGYVYNGSSYQTLDDPLGAYGNSAKGISGTTIVGAYVASPPGGGNVHGYIYNNGIFSTFDDPSAIPGQSIATGISGNTIVGNYSSVTGLHGFVYNGVMFTTLDDPLAGLVGILGSGMHTTTAGVSGGTIVGDYLDSEAGSHGYVYDGSTYTTLDDSLGVNGTYVTGIDGTTIVGYYVGGTGVGINGFIATAVPEPTSLSLWTVGALILLRRRRRSSTGK